MGDKLKQADGTLGEVRYVNTVAETRTMYNLEVEEAHTFFVGTQGWLVHNCGTATARIGNKTVRASELGVNYANRADTIYRGLDDAEKAVTTVAITRVNGKTIVSVNSNGAYDTVAKLAEERGWIMLPKSSLQGQAGHAEELLFQSTGSKVIGVSHRTGPCPECRQAFSNRDVEVAWTGIKK